MAGAQPGVLRGRAAVAAAERFERSLDGAPGGERLLACAFFPDTVRPRSSAYTRSQGLDRTPPARGDTTTPDPTSMSKNGPDRSDRAEIVRLRALAHSLRPVVTLGQSELTEAVTKEVDGALARHELIKVKLAAEGETECDAQAEALAEGSDSLLVQRIGHVAVLYREDPENSRRGRGAAGAKAADGAPAGNRGPATGRGPANRGFGGKGGGKGGSIASRRTGKRGDR